MINFFETKSARQFVEFWRGKGYEKGQTQPFWIGLLRVLGIENPDQGFIEFEEEVSKIAGAIVGRIYDAFLARYANPENPATLESLNQLCVRLVFLWYCEDAGVFPIHNQFADYLKRFPAWYWKAAEYMDNVANGQILPKPNANAQLGTGNIGTGNTSTMATFTRCAFVSTNSITQGEQVAPVFRPLVERYGFAIDFAHRTFVWNSDSDNKAHVHCVVVGFHCDGEERGQRGRLANYAETDAAPSAPSAESLRPLRSLPLFDGERVSLVPHINAYLVPAPDAFVESRRRPLCDVPPMTYGNKPSDDGNLLLSESERDAILRETPALAPFVRRYVGARDFIANDEVRYCLCLKNASPALYHFGVITSNVHNAWMRTICGRLKSDYRYSGAIVYNNFPWPEGSRRAAEPQSGSTEDLCASASLREKIERTAQAILDARAAHPDCSLKVLYDELTMPPDLRRAHQENDRAVMAAYGFKVGMTESECVAELFKRYQALAEAE